MITKIKKIERLIKYPENYFVYFDYNNKLEKTLITNKVLKFLKIIELKINDKIIIQKGFKNNKIKFLIVGVL